MNSINQFDYPSKQSQSYKNLSLNQSKLKGKSSQNKARYKQNMQFHMELQRNKVKQVQKLRKQQQAKKNKATLRTQLQKKKKELQNLEFLKQQAQQNQRKSYELALLKIQKDKIKKQQQQRQRKQFNQSAVNRFDDAMKRLYQQREQQSFKQRLAQQRRKTTDQYQRLQRIKAGKYKAFLQEKQKTLQKQQQESSQYKKTLKQSGINKNVDYNKTCLHNFKIIPQRKNEDLQNAFEKGILIRDFVKEKSEQKRIRNEQNRKVSIERGKQAANKIKKEKQYQRFEKQTQQEQKNYNINRIEAGKKNQFIGLKPGTLDQMQANKKLRSQQEFNKLFFDQPTNLSEELTKPASNYQILKSRMRHKELHFKNCNSNNFKPQSYFKQKQQSEIPCLSQGKYSFEEPEYSQFKNESRSHSNIHDNQCQDQNEEQQQNHDERGSNTKNDWRQTGIPNEKYISSQKQKKLSSNVQIGEQQIFKSKKTVKRQLKNNQEINNFNTDQMLRKYGLKHDFKQNKQQQKSGKESKNSTKKQNKRKVVQLGNICQNKENEREQLNYSSQSEEDSQL